MHPKLKTTLELVITLALISTCASHSTAAATNSWTLETPDRHCVISVHLGGQGDLTFDVLRDGKQVIENSPLGLRRDDQSFDRGLSIERAGDIEKRRETYDLFAGVTPHVDHELNYRSLQFHNANRSSIILDLAAANEGVAFRYRFDDQSNTVRVIQAELSGFKFATNSRAWLQPYHHASDYTPAYEDFYFNVSPGEPPPDSRSKGLGWVFPALFHVPDAKTWILLVESGTDRQYCACHLGPDSSSGLYQLAFPFANEVTKGQTNTVGPEPRYTLPWTMPWRVMILGETAGQIATSTLVTDLAPHSRIADTSWIRPGRASWCWWSYPDGPHTAERFNQFSDFAAKMGWEYTLFDAGWWGPGLSNLASHAKAQGVASLAWAHANDYYDSAKRSRKLDQMQAAGVRGVKVDFWCSDRQEAITAMHALFEDAASRKLLVNLHGCTVPRGWQRTWPNFLAAEAVLGNESYFYESRYTQKAAELNAVLPFTRNVAGPMDSTPVACSPKKYVRTTTAAHELATALIFTSGLIHYADKPEFFESLPAQALQILRDAPARWEETRCLLGEPGKLVVYARRSGNSWFVAGINGTGDPMPIRLDLSPFSKFDHRTLIAEGTDPIMNVDAQSVATADQWDHQIPPRGGFILRLNQ